MRVCGSNVFWSSHESTFDGVRGNPEGTDRPLLVAAANVMRAWAGCPLIEQNGSEGIHENLRKLRLNVGFEIMDVLH
jgi:hypothetical protein